MRYLERLLRLFGDGRYIVRILFERFFCEERGLYFYPGLCDIRAQACALKRKQPRFPAERGALRQMPEKLHFFVGTRRDLFEIHLFSSDMK